MATPQFLVTLKEYWPIVVGFVIVILAIGEARVRIDQLMSDRSIDAAQELKMELMSQRIAAVQSEILVFKTKHAKIDEVITPESMQKWGQVQADVARHEQEIYRIHTRLGSRSLQPAPIER